MADPCGQTPLMTPTAMTSRWARLKGWMVSLPGLLTKYLSQAFDATDRTVETRLIMFALGSLLIMSLIAWEFWITRKLNNTALATLAGLISVGSLSTMHRGDQ